MNEIPQVESTCGMDTGTEALPELQLDSQLQDLRHRDVLGQELRSGNGSILSRLQLIRPAPPKTWAEWQAEGEAWQKDQAIRKAEEQQKGRVKKAMKRAAGPKPVGPKVSKPPKRRGVKPGYRQSLYKQLCRCADASRRTCT
ncbi:hypothetical protein H2203_004762 [Taxawa tesnikishii (nom. ined.)]|nr:hypothetical protein H2203_004762 [Dothideales sp. JES 119]